MTFTFRWAAAFLPLGAVSCSFMTSGSVWPDAGLRATVSEKETVPETGCLLKCATVTCDADLLAGASDDRLAVSHTSRRSLLPFAFTLPRTLDPRWVAFTLIFAKLGPPPPGADEVVCELVEVVVVVGVDVVVVVLVVLVDEVVLTVLLLELLELVELVDEVAASTMIVAFISVGWASQVKL